MPAIRRVVSKRVLYVELDNDGVTRHLHYAPYLRLPAAGGRPASRRLAILAVCAVEWELFLADAVVETHDRIVGRTYREAARTCEGQLGDETAAVREALRAFAELGTALIDHLGTARVRARPRRRGATEWRARPEGAAAPADGVVALVDLERLVGVVAHAIRKHVPVHRPELAAARVQAARRPERLDARLGVSRGGCLLRTIALLA